MRLIPKMLLLALALTAWRGAEAQLVVQVTRGAAQALPIAVVPFGDSAQAGGIDPAAVVAADLDRSGLFRALPRSAICSLAKSLSANSASAGAA